MQLGVGWVFVSIASVTVFACGGHASPEGLGGGDALAFVTNGSRWAANSPTELTFVVDIRFEDPERCPMLENFAGRWRGVDMEVVSSGSVELGACEYPKLEILSASSVDSTSNEVELRDATGSVRIEFPPGVLDPREARQIPDQVPWQLVEGQVARFAWSHPEDLGTVDIYLRYEELPRGVLRSFNFQANGATSREGELAFDVVRAGDLQRGIGGEAVIVAGESSGEAIVCTGAAACGFDIRHEVVQAADSVVTKILQP